MAYHDYTPIGQTARLGEWFMGFKIKLRRVERRLRTDLEETTISFSLLGERYGVTRQAIFNFCHRHGIKRPNREHTPRNCPICKALIKMAKRPHGDFTFSETITKKLGLGTKDWRQPSFYSEKERARLSEVWEITF